MLTIPIDPELNLLLDTENNRYSYLMGNTGPEFASWLYYESMEQFDNSVRITFEDQPTKTLFINLNDYEPMGS